MKDCPLRADEIRPLQPRGHRYQCLRTIPLRRLARAPGPGSRNLYDAEGYVGEWSVDAQATQTWRLNGSYSYLDLQIRPKTVAPGQSNDGSARNNPRHQFLLRSSLDLPARIGFDASFRYVGRLPGPMVPGCSSLDARLSWRPSRRVELAAVGQNLLEDHHTEFSGGAQIQRGGYGQVTLRW